MRNIPQRSGDRFRATAVGEIRCAVHLPEHRASPKNVTAVASAWGRNFGVKLVRSKLDAMRCSGREAARRRPRRSDGAFARFVIPLAC
jgi:hypothetical protein